MFTKRYTSFLKSGAVAAVCSPMIFAPATQASVNLWWNHIETTDLSQSACTAQAEQFLTSEGKGRVTADQDSVRSWSEHLIAVVECLELDDSTTVMVLVGSDKEKVKEGGALYNKLIQLMKKNE